MSELKVDFPPRNGGFSDATAIHVTPLMDHIVLVNLTREQERFGRIVLPTDRNTIRDVANYLHRVADKLP